MLCESSVHVVVLFGLEATQDQVVGGLFCTSAEDDLIQEQCFHNPLLTLKPINDESTTTRSSAGQAQTIDVSMEFLEAVCSRHPDNTLAASNNLTMQQRIAKR